MKHKDGYVYFLRQKIESSIYDKNNNTSNKSKYKYKIGYTTQPIQRFKTHRTSNIDFTIAYIIKNADMNYEHFLHRYFSDYRIEKEWFEDFNCIITNYIKRDKITRQVLADENINEGNH